MHIAIVHGYLLEGTGSNLYVQNLCREFCRLGHQVSLFCQEQNRDKFDFITRAVDFYPDNYTMNVVFERETPFPGKCTIYRPDLGGLLPVYVFDHYAGYRVKEFTDLSVSEIEDYIERNRSAMESSFRHSCPDLLLSNHLIMQPVYTVRACQLLGEVPHILTVHGSCLNFSVRKSPLLKHYALDAVQSADRIVFVSNYAQQEFLDFFKNKPVLAQKTVVIPAGVDLKKFSPLGNTERKDERIGRLLDSLAQAKEPKGRTGEDKYKFRQAVAKVKEKEELLPLLETIDQMESRATDTDTAEKLAEIEWRHNPVVLYYGKYLWTKGIQLLIAAAPLVLRQQPDTCFILAGFGSFRGYLEAIVAALDSGRRDLFYDLLLDPRFYNRDVDPVAAFYHESLLQKLCEQEFADNYYTAARGKLAQKIIFTGYIGHDGLKDLIPCSDLAVAPSVFPESFGMVAVEALASGVIPLQTDHSGYAEIIEEYSKAFPDLFKGSKLKTLLLDDALVLNLGQNIITMLQYYKAKTEQERQQLRDTAYQLVEEKYSWESIAMRYFALFKETQIRDSRK